MAETTRHAIDDFLAQRRLAVVGASREPRHFSRSILRDRGYQVFPVNPQAREIDGLPCAPRVQALVPPVDGAVVMTPAAKGEDAVRDCIAGHVPRVWLYRGGGEGAVSERAVALCREAGIVVVPGACPFIFLRGAGAGHRLHGGVLRLSGRDPR